MDHCHIEVDLHIRRRTRGNAHAHRCDRSIRIGREKAADVVELDVHSVEMYINAQVSLARFPRAAVGDKVRAESARERAAWSMLLQGKPGWTPRRC